MGTPCRILVRIDAPSTTIRIWDGAGGPFLDANGHIWRSAVFTEGALDEIERAINGEALTIAPVLSGVDSQISDALWRDYEAGEVVGSTVQVLIQDLDEFEQPVGAADVEFTGTIDDLVFADDSSSGAPRSTVTVEITNRFTVSTLGSGAVLSDTDQRARAKAANPTEPDDRFCERTGALLDKTIAWPDW